jgi:hypothetical protein
MASDKQGPQNVDITRDGVEFAPWSTCVETDDLHFFRLGFDLGSPLVTDFRRGLSYSLPSVSNPRAHELEATFISIDKGAEIRFAFDDVIAFRVLDENGLLELWEASAITPRPAETTFRARGHAWANESFLVFLGDGESPRFSYLVATSDLCLEVVCSREPKVTEVGPAVITKADASGS